MKNPIVVDKSSSSIEVKGTLYSNLIQKFKVKIFKIIETILPNFQCFITLFSKNYEKKIALEIESRITEEIERKSKETIAKLLRFSGSSNDH